MIGLMKLQLQMFVYDRVDETTATNVCQDRVDDTTATNICIRQG